MVKLLVDRTSLQSVLVMGALAEAHDSFTEGHQWRVSQYAEKLGGALGYSEGACFLILLGAYLHDLGKIGIPDAILDKKGRLTDDEYTIVKEHCRIGYEVMREHPLAPLVRDILLQHHEWENGRGYPLGLKGDQINPYAGIVSICDAFDAMTNTRPYRSPLSIDKAISELKHSRGSQFRAELVDAFLGLIERGALDFVLEHRDEEISVDASNRSALIEMPRLEGRGHRIHFQGHEGRMFVHDENDCILIELPPSANDLPDVDLAQYAAADVDLTNVPRFWER